MPEYTFELERTSYYNHRRSLLKQIQAPKLSDAKKNLGDNLAKVVSDQCEDALREDFGLTPPLNGPGMLLWVSPSDLLIGKVALKPPFTPKCLQALTHKGILEIGEGLEQKFKEEMEAEKQKTLDKYKAELVASVEDKMKSEIKDVEIRERLACHIEMERKQEEFEMTLKDELNKLERRVRDQYEDLLAEQNIQLTSKWEEKMQKEVKKTMEIMTKQYQEQLAQQEEKLSEAFTLEIRKEEILRDHDATQYKRKMIEALRQLKHNLECTNLVNMMYVLATERRKCCDQKKLIEDYYKEEIRKLKDRIVEKDRKIAAVVEEKRKQIKEVNIREIIVLEVIKQFQKFINFAFKSAPTQGEFLLSVEKMMVFELAKEVATTPVPMKIKERAVIPWPHDGTSDKSSISSEEISTLDIKDHHNCLNELNPPMKPDAELGENDVLPAIYFKNKTYIREDFRDMLDVGLPMTPSNDLWNRDVEILMHKWDDMTKDDAKPTEEPLLPKRDSDETHVEYSAVEGPDDTSDYIAPERRRSNKSMVQFVSGEMTTTEKVESQTRRSSVESKRASRRSSIKPTAYFFVPPSEIPIIPAEEESLTVKDLGPKPASSMLLAVRDSLELLSEKRRKSAGVMAPSDTESFIPQEPSITENVIDPLDEPPILKLSIKSESCPKELVVETKDSLIMRMKQMVRNQSSREFLTEPKDSVELKKHQSVHSTDKLKMQGSRLIGARNSIELLRESLHKLSIPSVLCQKKDKQESEEVKGAQSTSFAGTCCDKCKRLKELELIDAMSSRSSDQARGLAMMDADEKSVKISCIQVINLDPTTASQSAVSFNTKISYLKEKKRANKAPSRGHSVKSSAKSSARSKKPKEKPPPVKEKPIYYCNVVGDRDATEGEESNQEFTTNRIHSLVKLMSEQPDLMRLFTAGSR